MRVDLTCARSYHAPHLKALLEPEDDGGYSYAYGEERESKGALDASATRRPFSDVCFRVVGPDQQEARIEAHRNILISRSAYFKVWCVPLDRFSNYFKR